ncbi:hypothetical protein [Marivita sp. GX14005]|uniref:hypothetical protein n=1 Tax=Marivita sp. GX14005 TaxID=2942276 RepID=UPI00201A1D06|nr:hypothetical protein [Marivita sp. GX14005]MCL3881048.1 hypothetical protein [Marivita sp. GX14005]
MLKSLATTALFTAIASLAAASGSGAPGTHEVNGGAFTYEAFETAVAHADLAECPAPFDNDTAFCRLTLKDDMAHVFVFSLDGDQPLIAVQSRDLNDGLLSF